MLEINICSLAALRVLDRSSLNFFNNDNSNDNCDDDDEDNDDKKVQNIITNK